MRKISLITIFLLVSVMCSGQKKVFEKTVEDELFSTDKGPNKKTFNHVYFQYSLLPVDYSGAEINLFKSNSFGLGYRYKFKLSDFYSFGFDVGYLRNNFNLKQNNQKRLPNAIQHENEALATNNLSFEVYQRANIGKAGNMLGLYFDVGGYAGFIFMPKHTYKDKVTDEEFNSEIRITKHRGLKYFEPLCFGVRTKFGYNKLAIIGDYRISKLLKKKYDYPKLPDWSVGLQLSVF